MNSTSISIIAALLVGVSTTTDPIDKVVADLSANPVWGNGPSPIIDLPKNASTDEIVAKTLEVRGYSKKVKGYKIIEVKQVRINEPAPYIAVLIKSDDGENVVLLRYDGSTVGWENYVVNID